MKTIAVKFAIVAVMLASCNIHYGPSRKDIALKAAMAIEAAVNYFYVEYGYLPTKLTNDTQINTKDNITDFLNIILGLESPSGAPLNKRQIKFLNVNEGKNNFSTLNISVAIPCSGHAPLIIDEVKKVNGVKSITFEMSNKFHITYDATITSKEKILGASIFKDFPAKEI